MLLEASQKYVEKMVQVFYKRFQNLVSMKWILRT